MEDRNKLLAGIYDEKSIQIIEWHEHIRRRPGMYIGLVENGAEIVLGTSKADIWGFIVVFQPFDFFV